MPPDKTMDILIGHTVINIYDTNLDTPQIEALQNSLFSLQPQVPKQRLVLQYQPQAPKQRLVLQHHFYNYNNILDTQDRELVSQI